MEEFSRVVVNREPVEAAAEKAMFEVCSKRERILGRISQCLSIERSRHDFGVGAGVVGHQCQIIGCRKCQLRLETFGLRVTRILNHHTRIKTKDLYLERLVIGEVHRAVELHPPIQQSRLQTQFVSDAGFRIKWHHQVGNAITVTIHH